MACFKCKEGKIITESQKISMHMKKIIDSAWLCLIKKMTISDL